MLLDRKQTMNRRFISVLLALSLPTLVAACGSDEPDTGTSALALNGVYRPVDQGALGGIAFANGKDYRLVPASCTTESCVEIGTYRLDAQAHTLVLENGTTHATTTFALEVTKTSEASTSLVSSSVRPLDLVDPGEQLTRTGQDTAKTGQQTTQNGQQLANGGSQLSGAASHLLQLIQQMMMNGQQMKRDDDAKAQADKDKQAEEEKAKQKADPAPAAPPAPAPRPGAREPLTQPSGSDHAVLSSRYTWKKH